MLKRALFTLLLLLLPLSSFAAKTTFIEGVAATKTPGTRVTAAFLNATNNHRHDGKAVDGSGALDYAVATGSANAIAIALSPALTAHVEGMPIWLKVAADNTGPTTVAVNGLAAAPLYKNVGEPLEAGDIRGSQVIGISWAGSAYQLTNYQNQPPPPVTDAETLNGQTAAQLMPPGAVVSFGMPTVPSGWLLCDGRAVLRSAYPALYAAIGTTWGAGDNVSTFNLPDMRGEFLRGWDNGRGVDAGRAFASWQEDTLQNITGSLGVDDTSAAGADGAFAVGGELGGPGTNGTGNIMTFDASRVARTSAETRPRNVALLVCIKY